MILRIVITAIALTLAALTVHYVASVLFVSPQDWDVSEEAREKSMRGH